MHLIRSWRRFSICLLFVIVVMWWSSTSIPEFFLFRRSNQVQERFASIIFPTSFKSNRLTKFDKIKLENTNPKEPAKRNSTDEKLHKYDGGKFRSGDQTMNVNNDKTDKKNLNNVYGSGCPTNPYKSVLQYLLRYLINMMNFYKIKYFICRGSLLGQFRDGDIIPYDRDVDVCITDKEFTKLKHLASTKPFDLQQNQFFLALATNPTTVPMEKRIRIDCKGYEVSTKIDPCSFVKPWARLIFHMEYIDVFVLKELGEYFQNDEDNETHLVRDILPTKSCTFMGLKTHCPQNTTSSLLHYYEPDFATKPYYICRNNTWVNTSEHAKQKFHIWFRPL